ncbi:MAG: cation diffusion facilitator family transporter [Bacteroidia bacterium]
MRRRVYVGLVAGLGGSVVVVLLKFHAYQAGGGKALLSDVSESFVNLFTASLALYGFWLSNLPADAKHPYGHGKVHFVFGAVEGVMILLLGMELGRRFLFSEATELKVDTLPAAMAFQLQALGVNGLLMIILLYLGYRYRLLILRAEGMHLLTDCLTSIGVLGSLWGMQTYQWYALDTLVGWMIEGVILYSGGHLVWESVEGLMDSRDQKLLALLATTLQKNRKPQWIDLHNLRIQRYGNDLHVDGHITLPWFFSLQKAHNEVKDVEILLKRSLPAEKVEVFLHVDPCQPACCSVCALADCRYREKPFKAQILWDSTNLARDHKILADVPLQDGVST